MITDDTALAAKGYAVSTDKMRLHLGKWQTQPGWRARIRGILGKCRGLFTWANNEGSPYCAIGTHSKLYAHLGDELFDITPLRTSGSIPNNAFETTNGSADVDVAWTAHGFTTGDTIWITGVASFNGVTIGGGAGTYAADPFLVSSGSNIVIVTHVAHGMDDNDIVTIAAATAINGITPNGTFRVQVLTVDTYTIYAATSASSSGTGGGAVATYAIYKPYVVDVQTADLFTITVLTPANATGAGGGAGGLYQADINVGSATGGLSAAGYGSGPYGSGPYGTSTISSDAPILPRTWSLANWGEFLIANPYGGGIYQWELDPSARAALLTNAPARCNVILVTAERCVMALGCTNDGGEFDPLVIRNSDIEDNTIWVAAVDNSADQQRIAIGSAIVGALNTQGGLAIWTDVAFYSGTFQGIFDQIYSFDLVSSTTGLAGPNAAVDLNGDIHWMTPGYEIYRYSGGKPQAIEFPLKKWFTERLAPYNNFMIYAFIDVAYPAVTWLFPTSPDDECAEYIRLDVKEQARDPYAGWSIGTWDRTAWVAKSVFPLPMAVSSLGVLYEHEIGTGALETTPEETPDPEVLTAIERHLRYADIQLKTGDRVANVNAYIPDFVMGAGTVVDATLTYRRYPQDDAPVTKGPLEILPNTKRVSTRGQGRQLNLLLESDGTLDKWRVGTNRLDMTAGSLK